MKKIFNKFTKILLLVAMVISDLMSPIKVFADEIEAVTPKKGDVGINETVSDEGSVSVTKGSIENPGDVMVTKTVKKNGEGKFTVEFEVKGKDVENTTTVTKPVYAVVVFDRSGSMEEYNYNNCLSYGWFGFCNEYEEVKFSAAVSGAKTFASTLLEKIPNAQIGLVTFAKTASVAKDFNSNLENDLSDANFGNPDGGTNLHAGLIEANRLLSDSSIPENAKKYVVIISDGEPTLYIDDNGNSAGPGSSTDKDVYDNTKSMDDTIKEYAEVFSIGYSLPNGEVYNNMTAAQILENMATEDNTSEEDYVRHYYDSNPEEVAAAFSDIATSISKVNAGTGATINDNIGASFSVDANSSNLITVNGSSVSNTDKFDITEEGTKISFDVEINGDEADGWVNVNEGFTLTYTDANGEEKTITYGADEPQPQVYWERNKYNYTVNYYKDSIETGNEVGEPFVGEAEFSTTVSESDVNKNLRLSEAGEGYEFNSIENTPLTITDNEEENVINVLYTLKKFDYTVNYYYDGVKDNDKSYEVKDVTYGTVVNANELYFANTDEYSLDTKNSTSGNVTINDKGITIDIYYVKNSYNYSVHYNFNGTEDKDFAKNNLAALYGTELFAGNYYLSSEELSSKYSDYFLDPVDPGKSKNNETITVGNKENKLDIYYINTHFDNNSEETSKSTTTEKVTSSNQPVDYTITYKNTIKNVREGDKVTVTVVDNLPFEIVEDSSNLTITDENGNEIVGVYNSTDKTITWSFVETISEFAYEYKVNKNISFSVVYKDFADISSSEDNKLVNTASGMTTINGNSTDGDTSDSAEVPVRIEGKLTVIYRSDDEEFERTTTTKLAGSEYTTEAKEFFGYHLVEVNGSEKGVYVAEDTITVEYIYELNDGEITNNKVTKKGPKVISDVNDYTEYAFTYDGTVKDYIGKATLTLTDVLPYQIYYANYDGDRCDYDFENNTFTCKVEYDITEEDYVNGEYNIHEEFYLDVIYGEIDSDVITNKVDSKLELRKVYKDSESSVDSKVLKGDLLVSYVDEEGNVLDSYSITDYAGAYYETEEREFEGYTFKSSSDNTEGFLIANETIYVEYVYSKNVGTYEELPPQTGVENISSNYIGYILAAFLFILLGKKKEVKNN